MITTFHTNEMLERFKEYRSWLDEYASLPSKLNEAETARDKALAVYAAALESNADIIGKDERRLAAHNARMTALDERMRVARAHEVWQREMQDFRADIYRHPNAEPPVEPPHPKTVKVPDEPEPLTKVEGVKLQKALVELIGCAAEAAKAAVAFAEVRARGRELEAQLADLEAKTLQASVNAADKARAKEAAADAGRIAAARAELAKLDKADAEAAEKRKLLLKQIGNVE